MPLLNKEDGPFTSADEAAFREFASGVAVILETWMHLGSVARGN